ncbi:M48 metallopeptidase family protein [Trinickia dabaoshanensis]|uniref:M48 metallopeptidase family protein n=1 Tax=Trinickia dabaoshanensis TaxID=564714 RepID=UPI0022B8CB65|nr:M48 family metallopeptidase [Trinickia dabaoshanensis]
MKTNWRSFNPVSGNIRLNTHLACKPQDCLKYILVHELLHLIDADSQRAVSIADGPVHAAVAAGSRPVESTAGTA